MCGIHAPAQRMFWKYIITKQNYTLRRRCAFSVSLHPTKCSKLMRNGTLIEERPMERESRVEYVGPEECVGIHHTTASFVFVSQWLTRVLPYGYSSLIFTFPFSLFRCVHEIAKSDCLLHDICPSARKNSASAKRIFAKFYTEGFDYIYREN